MGELLDAIRKPPGGYKPATAKRPIHPSKEWEPRIDTDKGVIVARKPKESVDLHDIENAVDWDDHLRAWGFNPEHFTVQEPVEIRTWDAIPEQGVVQTFVYFKARIWRKRKRENLDALIAEIRKHRPVKIETRTGPAWLVVAAADWQLGKRDQGGSEGIVRRVLALNDSVIQRVKDLRRSGVELGGIAVVGMGDIVEGCKGFYPNQPNQIDLDRREQTTVARRLILSLIRSWSRLTPQMIVACVPGNHGENRNADGSYNTLPDKDNDDVAVFEQVAEILAENPERYGHVRFVIPNGEDSITLDLGTIVAFTHGHHAGRGGPGVMAKLWTWWTKQTHALHPIGDAMLLVSAHFHHLIVQQQGPKTHIQCPALEGGSDWYAKRQGYRTQPGTLTFTVTKDGGWDHLRIL